MKPPEKLLIVPDEFHLDDAGRCADGRNVIMTTQLIPSVGQTKDFICTFWFDNGGHLVAHRIDEVGIRGAYDEDGAKRIWASHADAVGVIDPQPFWVKPFSVDFDGQAFGLIPEQTEDGEWQVIFEPGNTMAFYAPWDSGEYDT
ncbi:MAG: hypothetical protein HY054_16265 [Proteobacteria bacterium]|nr:hypothetical protein [Pseudomonadota bacterium]